jgi:hypothetical protein
LLRNAAICIPHVHDNCAKIVQTLTRTVTMRPNGLKE